MTAGLAFIPIRDRADVLAEYRGTAIETLLTCHNLGHRPSSPPAPQLVIVTCMDHRVELRIPERFAFTIRTAGASLDPVVFNVTCAMALGDVRAVAIIGHSDCAMVDVDRHRGRFLEKVMALGALTDHQARELFESGARQFGIDDAAVQTVRRCEQVRRMFPGAVVGALYYDVEDGHLHQIA